MPLTKFQSEVLAVIVGNRSEQSHFAGGLVLNASEESAALFTCSSVIPTLTP
jgi:hypothetical protein